MESERRGLPDIWIHDNDDWALLIESKIASSIGTDQLRRHYETAKKRGAEKVTVLAITVTKPRSQLPEWVICRHWTDIYQWLIASSAASKISMLD